MSPLLPLIGGWLLQVQRERSALESDRGAVDRLVALFDQRDAITAACKRQEAPALMTLEQFDALLAEETRLRLDHDEWCAECNDDANEFDLYSRQRRDAAFAKLCAVEKQIADVLEAESRELGQ